MSEVSVSVREYLPMSSPRLGILFVKNTQRDPTRKTGLPTLELAIEGQRLTIILRDPGSCGRIHSYCATEEVSQFRRFALNFLGFPLEHRVQIVSRQVHSISRNWESLRNNVFSDWSQNLPKGAY